MTDEIEQLLKNLKLGRMRSIYDEQLRAQWHHRQESALEWRIRRANLPERWSLETFPYSRQPGVRREQMQGFAELDFVAKHENLVLIGGSSARTMVIASFTVQPGPQSRASPISSPRTFFMAWTQAMTCSRARSVMRPRSACGAPDRGSSYHALGTARIMAGLRKPTACLIQNTVPVKEHHRLEIRLGGLGLAVPGEALIRDDANYRVPADDGAPEVGDFVGCLPGALFRGCRSAALPGLERRRSGRPRQRSEKPSSRPMRHASLLLENTSNQSPSEGTILRSGAPCKPKAFTYPRGVFARIAEHPRERLEELLPGRWAGARSAGN
jgi:hypothetical protein